MALRKLSSSGLVSPAAAAGPLQLNGASDAIIPADTADSFIIGSDRMDRDTAAASKDIRAWFNKTKGAFRAGRATGNTWDSAKVADDSAAFGLNTTASGTQSFACGNATLASGSTAFAAGSSTTASGPSSFAEGSNTNAYGTYAHAEGFSTSSGGTASHAEGQQTNATGAQAHAEGLSTVASGGQSHAEGNSTTASGGYSHAQGANTLASSWYTHAEGSSSTASADLSRAEGSQSLADRWAQRSRSAGRFTVQGDAQVSEWVARASTTDATATTLFFSGTAPTLTGTTINVLTVPASRAFTAQIRAVARRTDVQGEMAGFTWTGLVGRDSSGNARIIGTPVTQGWADTPAAGWTLAVSVNTTDATNNYLQLTVTGEAAKTIRWVAGIEATEVGG